MRTADEIVAKIKRQQAEELFGFTTEVLISYLPFEHAKQFLHDGATAEQWSLDGFPYRNVREHILNEFTSYMVFAWGKVQDHRGLSADRSVMKLMEWTWLLGDDATLAAVIAAPYAFYGAPKLKIMCDAYGLPVPDDAATQRMIAGQPCGEGCRDCR